jgi:hypothetical protein
MRRLLQLLTLAFYGLLFAIFWSGVLWLLVNIPWGGGFM